jgi:hypothetical protein
MCAVEKLQNLIAQQAPILASIPRSCRQLDAAISGAARGTNDIGGSHARQPSITEPVILREGKGRIPQINRRLRRPTVMVTTSACCRLLTDTADVGVAGLEKLEKVLAKCKRS